MQFVPLWTSILNSRKVAELADDEYRIWTLCLVVAQEHDHRGGTLPTAEDLSYRLHLDSDTCLSRLSRLVTAGFLECRDGVYLIHDWEDWKHRPDPTGTARKRAQREREKLGMKGVTSKNGVPNASADVTVTAVTSQMSQCHAPTNLNNTNTNTHTPPLPPRDGGECVGVGVGVGGCEEASPRGEESPGPGPVTVVDWTPDQKRVIERATERWGASHGDMVIGDLLRTYPAALVAGACDTHFGHVQGRLNPARLMGLCRVMARRGEWDEGEGDGEVGREVVPLRRVKSDEELRAETEECNRRVLEYRGRRNGKA